jgi:AcrR family transcriptional regulator
VSQPTKRDRILDAAEALFAERGYDGVTLRQIASEARVDVALASYHFGKKLDLFNAVFERRADALNRSRLEALRRVQQGTHQQAQQLSKSLKPSCAPSSSLRRMRIQAGGIIWH